jgi:hypothetical protein
MATSAALHGFRHEALLYAREEGFLAATLPFIRAAIAGREPILVVVSAAKIDRLRRELGDDAAAVAFEDMAGVGTNPARIIPAWREFVDAHRAPGRRLRGIGEPVWAGRSACELAECQRHECLLKPRLRRRRRLLARLPLRHGRAGPGDRPARPIQPSRARARGRGAPE